MKKENIMEKDIKKFVNIDRDIQSGTPVFRNTRVPIDSLFWHLEKGITIDEFLQDFPSVSKEQVIGVLKISQKISSRSFKNTYENIN